MLILSILTLALFWLARRWVYYEWENMTMQIDLDVLRMDVEGIDWRMVEY
jgi:hypothetical protein